MSFWKAGFESKFLKLQENETLQSKVIHICIPRTWKCEVGGLPQVTG